MSRERAEAADRLIVALDRPGLIRLAKMTQDAGLYGGPGRARILPRDSLNDGGRVPPFSRHVAKVSFIHGQVSDSQRKAEKDPR